MNMIKKVCIRVAIVLLCVHSHSVGMNLSRAHDIFLRPPIPLEDQFMQTYLWFEHGLKQVGFNGEGKSVNVLQYIHCSQNALAMLDGFPDDSPIGQKRAQVAVVDDGVRGHYCVTGNLDIRFNAALAWRFFFGHNLTLGIYLPFKSMRLHNVYWRELTQMNNVQDALVKEFLTNDFFDNLNELGNGLNVCSWERTGVGDLTILLEFLRNFEQSKPMLKNVQLDLRGGLMIPTGKRQDADLIAAFPFGNDGAASAVFGGGIELLFGDWFKWGFDIELTHLFGNACERRIKTAEGQTDFLFLGKTKAYIDWGMQQQFTLFAQLYRFYRGASFKIGYRFFKQGDSVLSLCNNDFSPAIATSASSLEDDRTAHDVMLKLSYDFDEHFEKINPSLAICARIPFNGKRSIVSNTIGLMASIDF